MRNDEAIDAIKRDQEVFVRTLGLQRPTSSHNKCPRCGSDCLQTGVAKSGSGFWRFKCWKGCGEGSVIDALMIFSGLSQIDAVKKLLADYDPRLSQEWLERERGGKNGNGHNGHNGNGNGNGHKPVQKQIFQPVDDVLYDADGCPITVEEPHEEEVNFFDSVDSSPAPVEKPVRPVPPVHRSHTPPEQERNYLEHPVTQPRFAVMPKVPVVAQDEITPLVEGAHATLMDNWSLNKRGISKEVAQKYKLGLLVDEHVKLSSNPKAGKTLIELAWVLPITDDKNVIRAVKLHLEKPIKNYKGEVQKGKARWLPFGKTPAYDEATGTKPLNHWDTFWPHPDTQEDLIIKTDSDHASGDSGYWINKCTDGKLISALTNEYEAEILSKKYEAISQNRMISPNEEYAIHEVVFARYRQRIMESVCKSNTRNRDDGAAPEMARKVDYHDYVFVCPGELKALAVISAGYRACGVTTGEGRMPPQEYFDPFYGEKICILWDDDPVRVDTKGSLVCTGRQWGKSMTEHMKRAGAWDVISKTFGRKRG
jgi:hypothetical protein